MEHNRTFNTRLAAFASIQVAVVALAWLLSPSALIQALVAGAAVLVSCLWAGRWLFRVRPMGVASRDGNGDDEQRRFGSLFEALEDGALIIGESGLIQAGNRAACQMLNCAPEAVIGCSLADFIDLERALKVPGRVSRLEPAGAAPRYVEVTLGTGACAARGNEHYVFIRDVSSRYQAEREHRLLRACVAQIDDIIMITEAHPLEMPGPRIVFVNEALERITGYPREALIGRTPRVLQGPDTDPGSKKRIRAALDSYEPVKEVLVNYTCSGKPFWNQLDIVPISFQEEGEAFFCSVQRDVTDQRETEYRLRRANQALEEVREQERTRIARDLHDELGQLLSAIKLDLIRVRRAGDLDQVIKLVDSCNEAAEQAIAHVRSIATQLRPSLLDDLGFVAAAQALIEQWRPRMDASLLWHGPTRDGHELPKPVTTALFRVLQETLTNICRHARASRVDVRFAVGSESVSLEVEDDGVGFYPAQQKSSGLGLVGMRERIAGLNGRLQVISAPNEGCLVVVKLPIGENDTGESNTRANNLQENNIQENNGD